MSIKTFLGVIFGKPDIDILQKNDHIRAVCSPEVQVWEQTLLEQGILCKHGRRKQASRTKIYPKPRERGFDFKPNQYGGIL